MTGRGSSPRDPERKKSLLIGLIVLIGLALAAVLQSIFAVAHGEPIEHRPTSEVGTLRPVQELPAHLQQTVSQIAGSKEGRNALIVRSIEDGWTAGFQGAAIFRQGTFERVWLAAALLDAVDNGVMTLEQRVPVQDLDGQKSVRKEVRALLDSAVGGENRIAQAEIYKGLSSAAGLTSWARSKGLDELFFARADRPNRKDIFDARATVDGVAFALSELFAGRLLHQSSTDRLLGYFGPNPIHAAQLNRIVVWKIGKSAPRQGPVSQDAAEGAWLVRLEDGRHIVIVAFAEGGPRPAARKEQMLSQALQALQESRSALVPFSVRPVR